MEQDFVTIAANRCRNLEPLPGKKEPRSSSNRWLLWVGGVVVSLLLLGVCSVGGWVVYQKLTGSQTTSPLVQSTPIKTTITAIPEEPTATLVPDVPTTIPTEAPASGYIFFASGDFATGHRSDGDFVEGSWDLYTADPTGNNRNLIMHTTDDWIKGQFAPNGQWLWFEIQESSGVGDAYVSTDTVYAANADGSGLQKVYVPYDGYLDIFEFSGDGWSMYFREVRYDEDDPNVRDNYVVYNHRNGLVIDSNGYQVTEISSNSRWALLRKDYRTSKGWYESEEWSLVNMDTGQWKNFGRFEYAGFEFSHNEQDLIFQSYDDNLNTSYKIYNIASESWSTLDFRGEQRELNFLPDGAHLFLQEESTLYLTNISSGDRSTYLQGYPVYHSSRGSPFLFVGQRPRPTDRFLIAAFKSTEDENLPPDIYVADGDGTDPRIIAQDAQYATFLGDYQHVLLERVISENSEDEEAPHSFSIVDLRSGVEHPLPGEVYGYRLPIELSPDGIHILWHEYQLISDEYYGGKHVDWNTYKLWILNLGTMESRQLELAGVNWDAYYANFSSDGSRIIYGVLEFADDGWSLSNYATYVTNLDGSSLKLIGEKTFPIMFEHPLRD